MANSFHQNIVSSFIDGILLVSRDFQVMMGNPAAEELFGRSINQSSPLTLADLFPQETELSEKVASAWSTGLSCRDLECIGLRKSDLVPFPASVTLSPCIQDDGQPQGVILFVRDMSFVKDLEQASRQRDHLTTLEPLALGLAHEIRNPLGGIRGSAQLLLRELDNADHQQYMEVVIAEVDRINRMVKQMMSFTRPPDMQLKPLNIHKTLNDILLLQKEPLMQKGILVKTSYDPSLPDIDADEDQLTQVFLNLIKNSMEASPTDSKIRLTTRFSGHFAVLSSVDRSPTQNILVEITDFGCGIDEEKLGKLFTPFFTTKPKGSGMGLPISLRIIENHHGKIKVTSKKNTGTTVQVFLPVRQK
jgi:two-component system nitrogen regulation sensor histidine kinase GlnL